MIWPTVKKYAKYAAILLVGAAVIVLYVAVKSWLKKKPEGPDEGAETLKGVITEIGSKMTEANHQATVEIAAARDEENTVKTKLEQAMKVEDKAERRRQLADLYEEVSK